MHLGQFLGFAAVSLALALVPGPSWLYVITTTVSRHRHAGLIAVLGNATGIMGHVFAVAAGLSAILSYSTTVFLVVKWLGALYLVFLGIRSMRPSAAPNSGARDSAGDATPNAETHNRSARTTWQIFGNGILVNLLNPKVALVMLALLPQFTETTVGHVPAQIVLIGFVHAVIASLVLVTIVFATAGASARLRDVPRVGRIFRIVAGLMLIGVGLRLALSK